MSGIFQGYTNPDGRVRVSQVTAVPAGSANDRGMVVAGNRVIPYLVDSGQARVFHDGIAFDQATGLLLGGRRTATPLNISMGGLLVDVNGAVVLEELDAQVIHQGVGLREDGALAAEAEPIATFIANLHSNIASTTGPGTFTRASEGLYQDVNGVWRIAPEDVPRFEDNRFLKEPAATNRFLNSAAAATQSIDLPIGEFTFSVRGLGSVTSSNSGGAATGHGTAVDGAPVTLNVTSAGTILFTVTGSPSYVQVESGPFVTSPIVTHGAAASRAADALSYANLLSFFNQTEGMLVYQMFPRIDLNDTSGNKGLMTLRNTAVGLSYRTSTQFKTFDGVNASVVTFGSASPNEDYHVAVRWSTSANELQTGFKRNSGSWVWGTPPDPYGGAFQEDDILYIAPGNTDPTLFSNIAIYSEDRGTAWIEANYP